MGLCFSKKKKPCTDPPPNSNGKKGGKEKVKKKETKKEPAVVAPQKLTEPSVRDKNPVFILTQNTNKPNPSEQKDNNNHNKKPDQTIPSKKPQLNNKQESEPKPTGSTEETRPVPVPVRTSSCTKEELDAILIQCGRLSRSSSGKTSAETSGTHKRRYSGSKRSFDFDHEKQGEEEEERRTPSRPSPHRRTPSRERSGSRERNTGTGTGRRVSRSPGRRTEGPTNATSANEKHKPAKMVTVPAREKSGSVKTGTGSGTGTGKRNASPRSRSPAGVSRSENVGTLSRSNSRKGEQSPFRRNPMSELDENSLKGTQATVKSQKTNQTQLNKTESVISLRKGSTDDTKNHTVVTNCIRDQFVTCRVKDQDSKKTEEHFDPLGSFKSNEINFTNISVESFNSKSVVSTNRSSRRSSRDFDHQNPNNSYTNLLLEDIQNYHQTNNPNPNPNSVPFSLPACVSKACSILDAVADLNSSSSDAKMGFSPKEPFLESEIMVKDDLTEPSMHKYVSVRDLGGEVEPQESAGSNSFVPGQSQSQSQTWEPNSVDSTDRWARSESNNEVELEGHVGPTRQNGADRRLSKKREVERQRGSGRSGSRVTNGSGC